MYVDRFAITHDRKEIKHMLSKLSLGECLFYLSKKESCLATEQITTSVDTDRVSDPNITSEIKNKTPSKLIKAKQNKLKDMPEWISLRAKVIDKYGKRCMACGCYPPDSLLHVDHIKPRSIFPELTLEFDNLQVLCRDCNFKKGIEQFDFRGEIHD